MKKNEIIYSDEQLIIVNKSSGIPVQRTLENEKSLLQLVELKLKSKIFLTHRLDQVTSGICIFTKNKKTCSIVNSFLQHNKIDKTYLAVVIGGIAKEQDDLSMKIIHNTKTRRAYKNEKGIDSSLTYRKIHSSDNYDLLEVKIDSGRFHQIRVMLSEAGMPIKGDVKYGARRSNSDRSIHLHAYTVSFNHPKTREIVSFSAPLPSEKLWQYFETQMKTKN